MLTPSLVFAYWMRGSIAGLFYSIGARRRVRLGYGLHPKLHPGRRSSAVSSGRLVHRRLRHVALSVLAMNAGALAKVQAGAPSDVRTCVRRVA